MIVLDTNVVSELMRPSPNSAVESWIANRPACAYADIAASRRAVGQPAAEADCQIAAITRSRGMSLATRNVRDFRDMGVNVIDPWAAS